MKNEAIKFAKELRSLASIGIRRTQHGYYYISHYYPLLAQKEIGPKEASALLRQINLQDGFETYIDFPFCEVICSFCHFMKERVKKYDLTEREKTLLKAIETEIDLYQDVLGAKVQSHSLQIGGGTPSLMSNVGLDKILTFVDNSFNFDGTAEKKMEIFPKHHDKIELREKLSILRDHGFTDIVIDLESGNQETLTMIGRGISSLDAYLETVEICIDSGFDSIVTALMMGLPHETFDSLEHTVKTLIEIPQIKIINTFPTIIREPDPMIRQFRNHPEIFSDVEKRDAMWIMTRSMLQQAGFIEGPISYMHRPTKRPAQQTDKFECVNLLGFGPSAFGYWNGPDWAAQCFNFCNHHEYLDRISKKELPIWRSGVMDNSERARRKLIFGLANCKAENLRQIETKFNVSVNQLFGRILNALEAAEIIVRIGDDSIKYTEKGLCRLEEVSYFLGSEYVNEMVRKPITDLQHQDELARHNFYPTVDIEDCKKFKEFVRKFPEKFL